MSNWTAAEILLAIAVLTLAMPREDGFLLPERRDWLGWLRRLRPRVRRLREEAAGQEAERYVTDLREDRDQSFMTVRQNQLPSAVRRFETPLLSPPSDKKPPWKTAENPSWQQPANPQPEQEKRRRRAPGDPPTIVIELMRPAIAGDLGRYLARLPAYTDEESGGLLFVPPSSLALNGPDHHGAPDDVDGDQSQEDNLAPLQGEVEDAEVKLQERREERPGD